MTTRKRKYKYTDYVLKSIQSAKFAIETYNKIDFELNQSTSFIFLAQSWEMLAKALIIKSDNSYKNVFTAKDASISAEKALNKVCFEYKKITPDELAILMQVVSLRNEAVHDVLPNIPVEISTHLLYWSLKTFKETLQGNFNSYYKDGFDQDFISISFNNHTFYSDKVSKLYKYSRKYATENNKLLYLLDRGVELSSKPTKTRMISKVNWNERIKKLPRKARPAMHLALQKHLSNHDDVRFVPVHTPKGYKVEVHASKAKSSADATAVLVKQTDPNKDYPYSTKDLAIKMGRSVSFIARMAKDLDIRGDEHYSFVVKLGDKNEVPKYNDAALTKLKTHLESNPDYTPYR